ncbi:hypothetical protein E6O75_ATG05515 [Venturia nashicola]|uniref:Uncharacterized protein n=1 Tax=Venturia nashicola TaxID=86259 RepID=A0A4Z1P894_9PEZI|nr:hypothetical protein E6O75_ATG05515 [Venturia nashicola]
MKSRRSDRNHVTVTNFDTASKTIQRRERIFQEIIPEARENTDPTRQPSQTFYATSIQAISCSSKLSLLDDLNINNTFEYTDLEKHAEDG